MIVLGWTKPKTPWKLTQLSCSVRPLLGIPRIIVQCHTFEGEILGREEPYQFAPSCAAAALGDQSWLAYARPEICRFGKVKLF